VRPILSLPFFPNADLLFSWDFGDLPRAGERVVSLGERPYFSEKGRSRKEVIASGDVQLL
jgi:hypothetical protein